MPRIPRRCAARLTLALQDLHEPIGIGEGQRPHQHVVGQRERRRRRPHAEGGDDDRGQGEAGRAEERADGVAKILTKDVEVNPNCIHSGYSHAGMRRWRGQTG